MLVAMVTKLLLRVFESREDRSAMLFIEWEWLRSGFERTWSWSDSEWPCEGCLKSICEYPFFFTFPNFFFFGVSTSVPTPEILFSNVLFSASAAGTVEFPLSSAAICRASKFC